jgi:hypothetical protein
VAGGVGRRPDGAPRRDAAGRAARDLLGRRLLPALRRTARGPRSELRHRVGLHEHDGRLTRFDDATWRRRQEAALDALRVATRLDEAALAPAERTDLTLFTSQLLLELHEYARQDVRTVRPDLPLGAIAAVNDLLIRDFAPREERARHAVERLAQLPLVCADIRAKLAHPPVLWTRMAIDDIAGALKFLDTVPELAGGPSPDEVAGGMPPATPLPAGLDAALDAARTALTDYRDFLQAEVLPRSDGDFAIGRKEFEYRLHVGFLLDLDADRLLALGREQFDLTLAQLEATAGRSTRRATGARCSPR